MFMICSFRLSSKSTHVMGSIGGFQAGSLFLAVVPDTAVASRMYRLAEAIKCARQFQGAITGRDSLHVTLFFLGDVNGLSERRVRMVLEAAAEVKTPPFDISFDRTASFRGKPGRHPFVLLGGDGLNPLKSFRQALGAEMTKNGLKQRANADFTPHVTLLRDVRKVEEQPIVPICWTVREFVLIHSERGHTHLARWPLGSVLE
jgi:2'-5' RNA ligase